MTEVQASPTFPRSHLVERVTQYESVSSWLQTARDYYSSAKEKNAIIRYGCTKIESNLESVKNVAQHSTVLKNLATPILSTADSLGCIGLDKLEQLNDTYKPIEKVDQLKKSATNTVQNITETGKQFVEANVVNPVDDYLKTSILSYPLGFALNSTDKLIEIILPENVAKKEKIPLPQSTKEEKTEEGDVFPDVTPFHFPRGVQKAPTSTEPGPIHRAGQLSKKAQARLMVKLQNLKMRSPDAVAAMHHCVDLINYAANHLDAGLHQIRQTGNEKYSEIQHQLSTTKEAALNNIRGRVARARDTLQEASVVVKNIPTIIATKTDELRKEKGETEESELSPPAPHLWMTSPTPQQLLDSTVDAANISVAVLRSLSADLRAWFAQRAATASAFPNAAAAHLPDTTVSHLQMVKGKLQETLNLLNSVLHNAPSHFAAATATVSRAAAATQWTTVQGKSKKSSEEEHTTPSKHAKSEEEEGKGVVMKKTSTSPMPVETVESEAVPVAPLPHLPSDPEGAHSSYKDALEVNLPHESEH